MHRRHRPHRPPSLVTGVLAIVLVVGCAGPQASTTAPGSPVPTASQPSVEPGQPSATPGQVGEAPRLALETVADGLRQPVDIAWRPDDPGSLFVVEQGGRIRIVRDGALVEQPLLDITGIVTAGGEQGLLGLAFHPDAADRRFFVYYTALDGSENLAAYQTLPNDRDRADPDSGTILLRMEDPFGNHNGGGLAFGPDGNLYVSTGDGGGGGDPLDSGRHLDTLLAKILRLDVDVASGADPPYAIPQGNPFVGVDNARPEIWLTGLRNPWRFRFDRTTGDLWIGDVGQNEREEIDVARAGVSGLDFGWNIMEGSLCFRDSGDDCLTDALTLPVTEYDHDEGIAVIGGTVYRGAAQPALRGWYVFADNGSGKFWVIDPTRNDLHEPTLALESGRSISAIAEDAAGELFATDLGGAILRVAVEGS